MYWSKEFLYQLCLKLWVTNEIWTYNLTDNDHKWEALTIEGLKPGSHERHKHKQRKQSITSPLGLAKPQNNNNFSLFRLLFCFWLMLELWSYVYDDPYVAGLTSFLCFALMLMLRLSCEPGLTIRDGGVKFRFEKSQVDSSKAWNNI